MIIQSSSCNNRGFTIIELLVVLLITSAISGILLQSLQQVMHLHERFGKVLIDGKYELLHRDWLLQLVSGLAPDETGGLYIFKGEEKSLSGLSFAMPGKLPGVLSPFKLEAIYQASDDQSYLYWIDVNKNNKMPILKWKGNKSKFIYIDDAGEAFNEWSLLLNKMQIQIPPLIIFEYGEKQDRKSLVFSIKVSGKSNTTPQFVWGK